MIWYKFSFLASIFILEGNSQYPSLTSELRRNQQKIRPAGPNSNLGHSNAENQVSSDRKSEIDQLNIEIEKVSREIDTLTKENGKLNGTIINLETSCEKDTTALKTQFNSLVAKSTENQKVMGNFLQKLQEEEAIHIQLEEELKQVSEVLEMLEFQYKIIWGDLHLKEKRRINGTTRWCTELSHALLSDEEGSLMARAHMSSPFRVRKHKMSDDDMKIVNLRNKLNIQGLMKNKVAAKLETLRRTHKALSDECERKIGNANILNQDTVHQIKNSEILIQKLQDDLKVAIDFSNSVRLEIKTGITFIKRLNERINKMKFELIPEYRKDEKCFAQIKERQ